MQFSQNLGQQSGQFATRPQAQTSQTTETTRYLCAAGHLSEKFQDYVMRHVIYEEHKALGESYGVDMPAVVSWCKSGIRRINIRDGILTGILALVVFGYFLVINQVIGFFNNLPFRSSPYSSYPYSSSPTDSAGFSLGSLIATLFVDLFVIFLMLIFVFMVVSFEKWIKRRWPAFRPGVITYPLLFIPLTIFGFFLIPLIWLTIFGELLVRFYGKPVNDLRRNTFDPYARPVPLDSDLERKLRESFVTGQRNVVAYSNYRPFAGAGYYKDGWSLVLDTSKGALDTSHLNSSSKHLAPRPFTVSNLYDAIEKDVWALGIKDVLEIEGKLYVHGQYLPEKPSFFNSASLRPVTSVDPRLVAQYKEHPTEDVRYYLCLRFNFWRGEMIFTTFLRFVQRGKELFTEVDYLLLPPMDPDCYWVDKREITPLISEIWELYKRSFDAPIRMWLGAPFRLFRGYFYAAQQRRLSRAARNNPAFDYGASTSIRQAASDDKYHLFFQELDEQMYLKIIEKQILETIINFLDAHQIDTTELRRREQMILNSHTIFNGSVTANALAIGSGAQANNTTTSTSTGQNGQP